MTKDNIYQAPRKPVAPFEFDHQVARVFDDMIHRSIPFYDEIIRRQAQLVRHHHEPGTNIYDLGCSNGNLGLHLCQIMDDKAFNLIAVDNSAPMLEVFEERLAATPFSDRITLLCKDIGQVPIDNASVVVLNFTLQFIPPDQRDGLIKRIYGGLIDGGVLLFSEKITHSDKAMADLQQDFYYAFKRENGYSELEISQKREALEKVLIPETLPLHLKRLRDAGFKAIDVWQKWFNFAAMIAVK